MKEAMLWVAALTSSCDLDTLNFAIRSSRTLMLWAFSFDETGVEAMAWTDGMVMEEGDREKEGERRRGVLNEGGGIVFCGYRKNFFSAKTPGVGSVS